MSPALLLPLTAVLSAAADPAPEAKPPAAPGTLVAVGYGGRRISSADGRTWGNLTEWAAKGGDDSNNLMSIAFGLGKFVAVGGGGWSRDTQAGHILVSADGKDWREVKKFPNRVNPVLFTDGRFVVGGPDKTLWWSTDGEEWRPGAKVDYTGWAFWFRQGAAGNGRFVMIGNSAPKQTEHWCLVTKDGEKIESLRTDLPKIRDIAFGAGRFVIVGPDGLRMSSADGVKWEHEANAEGENLGWVVWTGREFLAGGGKTTYSSADGIKWEAWPTKVPCKVLVGDAAAGVWVGTSWPGQMWYSADGKDWKKAPALPPNGMNAAVRSPAAK
jgi:hypothetical protein